MKGILVIAEARHGALRDVTFELVGAAVALREAAGEPLPVAVAVLDAAPERHAAALALAGVDEVLLCPAPAPAFEAQVAATAVSRLVERLAPVAVLVGHTVDGMAFAPGVAARASLGFASDVTALGWEAGVVATRGAYGGKLQAELEFPGKATTLLMVRPGAFAAPEGAGAPVARTVDLELTAPVVLHAGFEEAAAGDVDITKAPFLLSVGRGIGEADNLERFATLADRIGATLSVSRPLVDAGWAPPARQVGQSGKTVAPRVYLALGISGAVQHLAGIRGAETVIAVNSDPEAPIFSVADYGAVADLFEVADRLAAGFD